MNTNTVTIHADNTTFNAELIDFDPYEQRITVRVASMAHAFLIASKDDKDEPIDVLLPSNQWRKAQVRKWSTHAPFDFALTLMVDPIV